MTPTPVIIVGEVIVGESVTTGPVRSRPTGLDRLRESEVQYLDRAVRTHLDVGRLQIAVDDALLMRGFERLGDLFRDGQRFVQRNGTVSNAVSERRSFDQFHHERDGAIRLLEAVNVGDVRMIQGCEDFRFTPESGQPLGIAGERCRQDLDGDFAFEVRVARAIHLAHAARAEQGDDLVGADARAGGRVPSLLRGHEALQFLGPVLNQVDLRWRGVASISRVAAHDNEPSARREVVGPAPLGRWNYREIE